MHAVAKELLADGLERTEVFDLPFINEDSIDAVADVILKHHEVASAHYHNAVVTPNVDIMVHYKKNPDAIETKFVRKAHYVLPDGMPIVAASRFLGKPLQARLAGSDLFAALWPRLLADNRQVVVVCANNLIAEKLESQTSVSCLVPPLLSIDDGEQITQFTKKLVTLASGHKADYIFFGLGNPKDSFLSAKLLEAWDTTVSPPPLCLGLGASYAMYLNLEKRAPKWMQRYSLEWMYRLSRDPRRMTKRYLVTDTAFLGIFWSAWKKRH